MKTLFVRFLAASAFALTVAACSSSTTSSHSETVGDQCGRVISTFCSRATACSLKVASDCASSGQTSCCNGHCSESAISADSDIDVCTNAINGIACADLTAAANAGSLAGVLPSSCVGVVKHQSAPMHVQDESFGSLLSAQE